MRANPSPALTSQLTSEQMMWKAMGVPLARAATQSSFGFAIVNDESVINHTTPAFVSLLNFVGTPSGLSLTEHLDQHFRLAAGTASALFSSATSGSLLLCQGRDETQVTLEVADLVDGERIVIAISSEPSAVSPPVPVDESRIDPLTRLGNRSLMSDELAKWRHAHQDEERTVALIMMDLDKFKAVNDTLGHTAGDKLLMLVSDRLKRVARSEDTIARIGGDEFILLHPCLPDSNTAEKIAQRLVTLMGGPFLLDGQQVHIGASIGIAHLHRHTSSIEDLLKQADLALYDAKDAGRSSFRHFNPVLEERAVARREMELSLRRGMLLKEFKLFYQPQVRMPESALTGFEALIRWDSDTQGMVAPKDFIPLAEDTGEIHNIGEWVLREACQQAMSWPDHLKVAVNLSPVQLRNDRFSDIVSEALAISGLHPSRLELEVTEVILIGNSEAAMEHLWTLQRMGVSIAMDDFGTGYSSLGYLNSFPFSKIKIDESFVRGQQTDKSRSLMKAILSMGESYGMTTLAEGVETRDQFEQLISAGCQSAQGFHISHPMEASAIQSYIKNIETTSLPQDDNGHDEKESE